jgi:hypothetical protein
MHYRVLAVSLCDGRAIWELQLLSLSSSARELKLHCSSPNFKSEEISTECV